MNKSDLIDQVAMDTGVSKVDAGNVLAAITDTIGNQLANGDSVQIIGFGTFLTRDRAARVGRNPSTGEEIQISAAKVVAFKPGKKIKEKVNT